MTNGEEERCAVGFPGGSVVNNLPGSVGDASSFLGLGRSPGEGNGNPPQCSCLENPRDRGAWWASIYGVTQSQTQLKRLSSSNRCLYMTNGEE